MTMRFIRALAAAAVLSTLALGTAQAQICPTAPPGTNNNQCASTAFVQGAASTANITVGTSQIIGGTNTRVLYDNAGIVGEYQITGTGSVVMSSAPTIASPTFSGTVAGANTIPLSILQQSAANTMLGNWSGSTANVTANTMPSCPDTGGNHLNYVSGTGITCGTGIGNGITALTGDVTATGPGSVAATLATAQPGAHTWAAVQTFTLAPVFTDQSGSRTALGLGTAATQNTGTSGANLPFLNGVNTWSGANAFNSGASVAGLTVTSSFTATGLVGNASLVNASTTVNGQTCTLGSTCTITATAADIQVGVTTISSGTDTYILFNNAGVLGNKQPTGTGLAVLQTSPTLVTPALGVATATSLAIAGCTIGTDELCVTGQTSLGGTVAITGALTYGGVTLNNAVTGTGNMVLSTSPTLVTPVLGAATATSINGLTITSSTGTLTIANGKTLTVSNSITLAGTDSTTWTGPSTNATLASLNIEDQTLAGGANVTAKSLSTGSVTIDCGARPLQYITNDGAYTITAPAADGSCMLLVTNGASAGATTFSGFTVGSGTGGSLTTTNTNKFTISIWRINGTSGYTIFAHQ